MTKRAMIIFSLIILIYLIMAIFYSLTVPIGEAPDESAHLIYIKYLWEHRRFPIFQSSAGNYEAHQPPLYYLACLPIYAIFRGLGEDLVGEILRLFSIFLGGLVILLAYKSTRELYPANPLIPFCVAAFIAFLPLQIATAAAISNDSAAQLISTLTFWISTKNLRGTPGIRESVTMGVFLGLSLLIKTVCVLLIPLGLLALYLSSYQARLSKSSILKLMVITLGCVLVISGWWLFRNLVLYGDPFVYQKFQEIFAERPQPEDFYASGFSPLQYLWLVFSLTYAGFFGFVDLAHLKLESLLVFYDPGILTPPLFYCLWALGCLGAFIGFLLFLIRFRWGKSDLPISQKYGIIIMVLAIFLIFCSHLQFNANFFQAQARYLSPMIFPLGLVFVLGLYESGPGKMGAGLVLFSLFWLILTSMVSLILYVKPYYGF